MTLSLYNTLTRKKEEFLPLSGNTVTMYNCGPTVYNFVHIGNLRAFLFADTLRRVLEWDGYEVKQIMNITDVGHLVSDGDEGEDKMEKGAAREGKSAQEIAEFYTKSFFDDTEKLNIQKAFTYPKATEHVAEQIALIKTLEEKGFTYQISDGIYFDTSKFTDYGKMARLDLAGLKAGARVEENTKKRNASDFALWKFSPKDSERKQEWESPWGTGFPGWHLECSAMAMKYLGETIDIHTGGVDHIPVHHTNEIAQSECATGKQFARFWLHSEFVNIGGEKMAKSGENFITLQTVIDHAIFPIAYRYFVLSAHYHTLLNFSWEALSAAETALRKLHASFAEWEDLSTPLPTSPSKTVTDFRERFSDVINDDLGTPQALALLWEVAKDNMISPEEKRWFFLEADRVLALGFSQEKAHRIHLFPEPKSIEFGELPTQVQNLLREREDARTHKNWDHADALRNELFNLGYKVSDGEGGQEIHKL